MPEHEINHLRSLASWPRRVATAPTIPRDLRGMNDYRFDPERFAALRFPTLLRAGSDSPRIFKKVCRGREVCAAERSSARAAGPGAPGRHHGTRDGCERTHRLPARGVATIDHPQLTSEPDAGDASVRPLDNDRSVRRSDRICPPWFHWRGRNLNCREPFDRLRTSSRACSPT
jgi:hypothetical protein